GARLALVLEVIPFAMATKRGSPCLKTMPLRFRLGEGIGENLVRIVSAAVPADTFHGLDITSLLEPRLRGALHQAGLFPGIHGKCRTKSDSDQRERQQIFLHLS